MTDYLFLFLIVIGVNLMPAFGPPTWTILVLYMLNTELPVASVVLTGATAASSGRYMLASAVRLLGSRLPVRNRENLEAARKMIEQSRGKSLLALALFVISPLPSAQLFEAAGLMRVRLLPFTAAFFAGRVGAYFIYAAGAAKIRETSMGDAFRDSLTRPLAIGVQLVLLAMLVALTRVDWRRWMPDGKRGNPRQ